MKLLSVILISNIAIKGGKYAQAAGKNMLKQHYRRRCTPDNVKHTEGDL